MGRIGTALGLALAAALAGAALSACAAGPAGQPTAREAPTPSARTGSVGRAAGATPGRPERAQDATARPEKPAAEVVVHRPTRTPCTTNTRTQLVFVSIRQQRMWLCARHHIVRTDAVTTGMVGQYTATPTGTFQIQGRNRNTVLTLADGATYSVKYWIPFQAPLFGFHDASWQHFPYGSPKYKTAGSHGCVHLPLAAIAFLYHWADIGTTVRIKG